MTALKIATKQYGKKKLGKEKFGKHLVLQSIRFR